MSDAVFIWPINYAYKRTTSPRLIKATFGDGYIQTAPDGVNAAPASWSVVVQDTNNALDVPEAFLLDQLGDAFYWNDARGALLRVRCESWERSDRNCVDGTLTMTFDQVYDVPAPSTVALLGEEIILGA